MFNNTKEDHLIHELFTITTMYLVSKNVDFSCSSSKSSNSRYLQVKKPVKTKIRISDHWQERGDSIQILSIFDMAKIFHVL